MGCAVESDKKTGSKIFWCGEGITPCRMCGSPADFLCDYPVGSGQTCDAPLCHRHAIKQGAEWQDIHFCPTHIIIAQGLVNMGGVK